MTASAGARYGPYEILSPLGVGGMGEVYKARDTRLDRTVAVKIASGSFSERFEREARAVAALVAAHQKGITHRDIKPSNVMLVKSGAKLLDFGLARMERPVSGGDETV